VRAVGRVAQRQRQPGALAEYLRLKFLLLLGCLFNLTGLNDHLLWRETTGWDVSRSSFSFDRLTRERMERLLQIAF
jgi:hypothetical protein